MSAVLGNALAAVASSSDLKRKHDSSSEDTDCCPPKKWYYVLASESDIESEGTESIYSLQEKSTDLAKDTSDTCTKSSWSTDDEGRMIEFEVVSFTEEEQFHPLQSKDSSSSPEDPKSWLPEIENTGSLLLATMSADHSNSESDGDYLCGNFYKRGLYKFCVRCKDTNPNPIFRYCIRCHKLRKNFLPPRPKGGRKKKLPKSIVDSKHSVESGIGMSSSQSLQEDSEEIKINIDPDLCNVCMVRPRDGGYFHGRIVHNYSCYTCCIKIYNQNGRCPVCNLKIKQICKVIR